MRSENISKLMINILLLVLLLSSCESTKKTTVLQRKAKTKILEIKTFVNIQTALKARLPLSCVSYRTLNI
jgi:hypothetical protein